MSRTGVAAIIMAGVSVACIAFVVVLFLIKILWSWTIPDLCPGAVQQGLVAATISWLTAAKLAIFVAILSGIAGGHHSHKKQ